MANNPGTYLNEEQVRYVCERVAEIKKLPLMDPDGTPSDARGTALANLSREVGKTRTALYAIVRGEVDYARPWVAKWRQEQNGHAAHLPPMMHKPHNRVTEEQRALVKRLYNEEGLTYVQIAKRTGIAKGSLYAIVHDKKKAAARAKPTTANGTHKRKARRQRPSGNGIAHDIEAYLRARAEKARAELQARHDQERAALEEQLAASEGEAFHRFTELLTTPEAQA